MTTSALLARGLAWRLWLPLTLTCVVVLAALLMFDDVKLSLVEIWQALTGGDDSLAADVVIELYLPRTGAAFTAGGLLTFAGTLIRMLLRNPLADSYILGVSDGGVAATLTMMLPSLSQWLVQASTGTEALLSMTLVTVLVRQCLWRDEPDRTNTCLLLGGVVMASSWVGLITPISAVAPENKLHGIVSWMVGDLGGADRYTGALVVLATAVTVVLPCACDLDVLLVSETHTHTLGMSVARVCTLTYVAVSLYMAVAVAITGSIAFAGLLVPHMVRLAWARDVRIHLSATAMIDDGLLMLADLIARMLIVLTQLPVGVVTTMLGVPAFLHLLTWSTR